MTIRMTIQERLKDTETALHIAQVERDKWKSRAIKLAKFLGIRDCDIDDFEIFEHGRLIDVDAICKDIISALGIRDENYLLESEEAVYKRIKNAPTIIEADKAESEG